MQECKPFSKVQLGVGKWTSDASWIPLSLETWEIINSQSWECTIIKIFDSPRYYQYAELYCL